MVWERIQELKRREEQEGQRARQEAAQAAADRLKIEQEATVKARLQQEQKRQRALEVQEAKRKANKEVFESSGILSNMREIENGLRGNVRKHAMLVDLDAGTITLAWGNKFKTTSEGGITYEKFWEISYTGIMDYSYIKAEVNLGNGSIEVSGEHSKEVKKDQWQANKTVTQDLLAQAYLHPKRVNSKEERPSRYSSSGGSSSNSECCNN